jgi:hypothetical protein
MLTKGPARRVTIFLNGDALHHMTPLHDAVMTWEASDISAPITTTSATHIRSNCENLNVIGTSLRRSYHP